MFCEGMDKDLLKRLAERISSQEKDIGSMVMFDSKKYRPFPFEVKYFNPIGESKADRKICFVDGGNIEIMKGPSFSLHVIKLYFTIYQSNKRIDAQRYTLLCLITTMEQNGEIFLKAEGFPLTKTQKIFDPYLVSSVDPSVKQGISRCSPSYIGNVYRRLAEIALAREGVMRLSAHDIVIIDGDLHAKVAGEEEALDSLYGKANEKKVVIAGLAKTSDWVTNTGFPVISAIQKLAKGQEEKTWFYFPLAESKNELHKADLFIAKLADQAKYCFRVDIHNQLPYDPKEIFSLLKMNATDPSFPGYPYGLLDAHLFAKCSSQEKEYLAAKLLAVANEKKAEFDLLMNASNAHEILDRF